LTHERSGLFEDAMQTIRDKSHLLTRIGELLHQLPRENYTLLAYLFSHFAQVIQKSDQNKMSLPNVGMMLQPTLQMSQPLLNFFLKNGRALFSDVRIKKYSSPMKAPPGRISMDLPQSQSAIDEELQKQESLLQSLHEEIRRSNGQTVPEKENQLWDVQRIVTQLKRQKKLLKQIERNHQLTSPVSCTNESQLNSSKPCVEVFEEKQLLAVQQQLLAEIAAEEMAITHLERMLRDQGGQSSAGDSPVDDDETGSSDQLTDEEWEQKANVLEARTHELVEQIVHERNMCARLQAQIEMMNLDCEHNANEVLETTRL